ncbi:MAG: response regulator [Eubacteriales bacterium]|nr:response regulator [Eubacteriales bacterium]
MTILIAEDEPRAMRGLKNLIAMAGADYEVVGEAYDGKETLEKLRELSPDVCLTDIRMPIMDGIALIKAARAQGWKTRFVIISACEEFSIARQAISLGVEEYLVKPIMAEEVKELLARLAGKEAAPVSAGGGGLCAQHPDAHPLVMKALRIIESSYATHISQKKLAEDLGIAAEYFSYLFSKNTGTPFAKYLRRYRVEKSKELILQKLPLEEVAESVGFSDVKYFCRIFKEETGVSTTEFRRNSG